MSKVTSPASKGLRTREAIRERAVGVASVAGLEGLSVGGLARDLELSKSGLFAHFGSKEELQLARAGAAREIFVDRAVGRRKSMNSGWRRASGGSMSDER
jgi:AcrR family transcriptional regulator